MCLEVAGAWFLQAFEDLFGLCNVLEWILNIYLYTETYFIIINTKIKTYVLNNLHDVTGQ